MHNPHVAQQIKRCADSRQGLVRLIVGARLCGSAKNKVTVVFDGYPPAGRTSDMVNLCDVIFSRCVSADEKIQQMVAHARNPKVIVVVSDDRQVQSAARIEGAGIKSTEEFLRLGERDAGLRAKTGLGASPKHELTLRQVRQINEELARLWLK